MSAHLHVSGSLDHLWALVDAWQENMIIRGLAEKTRTDREIYLMHFFRKTRSSPEALTESIVAQFFKDMKHRSSTRQAYTAALKSAYKFLIRKKYLDIDNPAEDVVAKAVIYPPPDYYEDDEARRILIAAATKRNPRRAWAVVLLFETGGRIGSLAAVESRDIRHGRIHFRVVKYDHPYSVILTPFAQEAIDQLVALWEPEMGTLLGIAPSTLGTWFREAARAADMPEGRVNAHKARHTFATALLERTSDAIVTAESLGHQDLSTVMRYARGKENRMREIFSTPLIGSDEPLSRPLTRVDMSWAEG